MAMDRERTMIVAQMAMEALGGALQADGHTAPFEDLVAGANFDHSDEDIRMLFPDMDGITYNPNVLRESISRGLRIMDEGLAAIDQISDDADEAAMQQVAFHFIHGLISIIGASMLMLESSPMPFEFIAMGIQAKVVPHEPTQ